MTEHLAVKPDVICPTCASPSVQAVAMPRPSRSVIFLPIELIRYTFGFDSSSRVFANVCLACGQPWIPRSAEEQQLRARSGQLGVEAQSIELARLEAENPRLRLSRDNVRVAWAIVVAVLATIIALGVTTRR